MPGNSVGEAAVVRSRMIRRRSGCEGPGSASCFGRGPQNAGHSADSRSWLKVIDWEAHGGRPTSEPEDRCSATDSCLDGRIGGSSAARSAARAALARERLDAAFAVGASAPGRFAPFLMWGFRGVSSTARRKPVPVATSAGGCAVLDNRWRGGRSDAWGRSFGRVRSPASQVSRRRYQSYCPRSSIAISSETQRKLEMSRAGGQIAGPGASGALIEVSRRAGRGPWRS